MASKRSIPTTLFASPDFFELSSNTTRLILIGIILDADDEGRGSAHPRLLARKLDQSLEDIEQALEEFAEHGILQCYEIAGRRYYWLCHWHKYQTLSKPTPSLYPVPPNGQPGEALLASGKAPKVSQETPGQSWETPLEEKRREKEEEEKRTEAEGERPKGITDITTPASNSSSDSSLSLKKHQEVTQHVASLLNLPMSQELEEVVQEFLSVPTISLTGEAIEAHAWITDTRRNGKQQQMTPAFFRRWLRRSQQHTQPLAHQSERQTSKAVVQKPATEEDQYAVYINRLLAEYNGPEALQEVS